MDPLATPPTVAALLAVIRDGGVDAETKTALWHSVQAWSPSYHYLRTALGGHRLPFLAIQGYSAIFAHVALDLAHAILDGMAHTLRCFFHLPSVPLAGSHTHLIATFPHLCTAYRLLGDPEDVHARMRALHSQLQAYRAPSSPPPLTPATLYQVVTILDQYIIVICTFLGRNIQHAILGTDTRPTPGP